MRSTDPRESYLRVLRRVAYVMLALTTLVLMLNAHDSALAKTPLFVLCALLIMALSFAMWIHRGSLEIGLSMSGGAVLLFLLAAVVSALFSQHQDRVIPALLFQLSSTVAFFSGSILFDRKDRFHRLLNVVACIAAVVAVVGVLQFVLGDRLALDVFLDQNRRVGSTLGNAAFLSGYAVLVLPMIIVRVLDKTLAGSVRFLHGVLVVSLVFLLIVSQSRSSYAAFAVSGLALVILISHLNKRALFLLLAAVILGGVIAVVVAPNLGTRVREAFSFGPTSTFARRLYFWGAGAEAFRAAPVLGHGPGSYEVVMREYRSPEYWIVKSEDVVPHAHNEMVETASDLGLAGVLAFLTIIGFAFVSIRRILRNGNPWQRLYCAGVSCSLLAVFIDNMANVSLRQAPVAALAWLLLGVLDARIFQSLPVASKVISFPAGRRLALVPLAAWCVAAWLMWTSFRQTAESDRHIAAGVVAHVNGRTEKAVTEFTAALAIDPGNLFVRSNLCLTLLKAGRFSELLAATREIHRYSPLYPKSNLMQAIALYSLKHYPEASESIRREIPLRTHPEAFYVQALICRSLGDPPGERLALENLLRGCIRGRLAYQVEFAVGRLLASSPGRKDLEGVRDLVLQLNHAMPDLEVAQRLLRDVDVRLAIPE